MAIKIMKKKRNLSEALGEDAAAVKLEKVSKKKLKLQHEESAPIADEKPAKKIKKKKLKTDAEVAAEVADNLEEATAKKKKKKDKNQQVATENGNEEEEEAAQVALKKKSKKTHNTFKFLEFRKKLRGDNFIAEIRNFLQFAQNRRFLAKYLEKRGKPLELVEALDRIEKTNVLHVNYIFQALHMLLLEIVANNKKHMPVAEQACRYFIKSQSAVIDTLMNSPTLQHRHTALKLLTAIVCVDAQLGKQLLNTADFISNPQTIEKLLSHNEKELAAAESVRKLYIHFILSYLINGNVLLIQNILDRPALIRALIAGLQFDDHLTVCLVLNSLRKYVLELPDISKTKKYHVFDQECCKNLAALYDWYGPQAYEQQCKQQISKREMQKFVNTSELEAVQSVLHEFMLELLTSRKNGICFNAIKNMNSLHHRQKHNAIPGKTIMFLYKPWSCELKTQLVVKILIACPELGRQTMRHFNRIVDFLRTFNNEWVAAVNFLATLIDTLKPELLGVLQNKITLTDLTYWVKDVCLPMDTLVLLQKSNVLKSKHYEFRLAATRLLYTMFKQYANYVTMQENAVKALQRVVNDSLRRFKLELLNHILVHFPTVEKILLSFNMTLSADNPAQTLEHMEVCLDLLLVICKQNVSFVDKTVNILEFLELTRPYYSTDQPGGGSLRVEMKAVKTMLALFPKALSPDRPMFQSILKSFIKAFVSDAAEDKHEVRNILREMFKNTRFFESSELEIDLWLEALLLVDEYTVQIVTVVFIEVLQLSKDDLDLDDTVTQSAQDNTTHDNLQQLFKNISAGLSLEAYVEVVKPSLLMQLIFKGVDIAEPLSNYLQIVCLLLYHYTPQPLEIIALYKSEFKAYNKYMTNALQNVQTTLLPTHNLIENIPFYKELQSCFHNDTDNIKELVEKLTANKQNPHVQIIYIQYMLFLVLQSIEQQQLTHMQADKAAQLINASLQHIAAQEQQLALLGKLLHYIFAIRLGQMHSVQFFALNNAALHNYVHFLCLLADYCKTLPDFSLYAAHFRQKLHNGVILSLQQRLQIKAKTLDLMENVKLVQCLNLTAEHCVHMLTELLKQLKPEDFYISSEACKASIYYHLVVCLLQQLADVKKTVDNGELISKKLAKILMQLMQVVSLDIEALELAFLDYLLINNQCIGSLKAEFFAGILQQQKISKSTIKLACLLLARNDKLTDTYLQQVPQLLEKRELVYSLTAVAFKKSIQLPADLLQTIYNEFKKSLIKAIEKPRKAPAMYREQVCSGLELIRRCMPASECLDYCQKQLKFDGVEYFQLQLYQAIFAKARSEQQTLSSNVYVNYLSSIVQMLMQDLKQQLQVDNKKLQLYGYVINDCLQQPQSESVDYSKLYQSQNWSNFCKNCLKLGMQALNVETLTKEELVAAQDKQACLLKILAVLCLHLLKEQDDTQTALHIFEMLTSHSQFLHILLSQQLKSLKTQLLHLMYVLAKKSPYMLADHVEPILVLLGAYQARLTDSDRYALALLQMYEQHATAALHKYRPFVWGESAITYYGLRNEQDSAQNLSKQEASIEQVMSLWNSDVSEFTLENFPIWRKLQTQQQMPVVEFKHPETEFMHLGYNQLEIDLEAGLPALPKSHLNVAIGKPEIYEQCYDPAFFVPLMSMCFAPGMYAHPARPVQNGLLGLCITALSAQDTDMRLAAASVQMRYRAHFEQHKFAMRDLWTQVYDNLQAGLDELRNSWLRYKKVAETPRVPLFATLYVARALHMTNNPTHLLYKELIMYMRLKESFNFQSIPNFNVLFYSKETEHQQYRQFIVEIIRHGVKSSADVFLLVMTNTFKVLLGSFGNSNICSLELTLMLLSIVAKSVKIPASAKLLIEHVGIISWLHTAAVSLKFHQFDIIEGLISISYNLWYALKASAVKFHNYAHLRLRIHEIVLQIVPHMSTRISVRGFAKLLRVMQQTQFVVGDVKTITEEQLDRLINCAGCHFPEFIYSIENIRKFGDNGVESCESFCEQLYNKQANIDAIISLSSLRTYTICWFNQQQQQQQLVSV